MKKEDPLVRLMRRLEVQSNGCWEYQGCRAHYGHGVISVNLKAVLAHRFAYEQLVGPVPDGLCVCHSCDNPPCCNPEHLWLGTQLENCLDRDVKGRTARGEKSGNAVLSDADRAEVARRYIRGARGGGPGSAKQLAAEYGVSAQTVQATRRIPRPERTAS